MTRAVVARLHVRPRERTHEPADTPHRHRENRRVLDRDRGRARAQRLYDRLPHRASVRRRGAASQAARLALADLLRRQKQCPDAEQELEQAITLDPQSQDAYLALAQQSFEQKAYDKAGAVLQRLVGVQPGNAQAYYLLGRVAIENEKWDEALDRLRRATELDPDHDASSSALGYVYETRNQPEE